jgi:hypothetical protein
MIFQKNIIWEADMEFLSNVKTYELERIFGNFLFL